MKSDALVYGESAKAILGALAGMKVDVADDGMHHFDGQLAPGREGPVIRALLRAEAGLLLDDASCFPGDETLRTPRTTSGRRLLRGRDRSR